MSYLCCTNNTENPDMDRTEELIVMQLREGNEWAYKFLYDHHYRILCHVAAQYVHDAFLAETIVGDIIFHLWEIRENLEIKTGIRSYLMASVKHRCLDYLKSQQCQREVSGMQDFPMLDHLKGDEYPLGRLLEKELEGEIINAIERLPEESRRVFQLSRFEDKKYEEIAASLHISVNTVKYHIKRALALLHKDLDKFLVAVMLVLLEQIE